MENIIDKITSNTYKILKQMHSCQVALPDGTQYVPLSQAELSRIIGVSTITMNRAFKELKEDGLVNPVEGVRGKYQLTDKAIVILQGIETLESKLEGARENG